MNKYDDLELSILSCLLQKPKLMNEVILEDKYFIKHQKIWIFMKSFYKKFGNFDLTLMVSVCKDKYRITEYIMWLLDKEPAPSLFNYYQKRLIELYEETKKEKYIKQEIFKLSNDLIVGNVELNNFKNEIDKIFNNAEIIFKN